MKANVTILIVDDDADDAALLQAVAERNVLRTDVHTVSSVAAAQQFLTGAPPFADRNEFPRPAMILIDLRMPGQDGFELLRWLKSHPTLKTIPAVIYTWTDNPEDVRHAYELGANAVMRKRVSKAGTIAAMRSMFRYWLEDSRSPGTPT